MSAPPALRVRHLRKQFPGVVANEDVSLTLRAGTVHAVVGENGAGKSTLMKLLYGMHRPDSGEIHLDGEPVRFTSPRDAIAAGLGMVHQHFMLADNLSVLENVVLGAEPGRAGVLDLPAATRRVEEVCADLGVTVDPHAETGALSVADRQRVEIVKSLYRGARILILDEPTAVLVPQEVERLFASLDRLRTRGLSILFISHKLDEVLAVADDVTVIRRGVTVADSLPANEVSSRELAHLMIGAELVRTERPARPAGRLALRLEEVSLRLADGRQALDSVSLDVREGEVVGIAGVEGNGQTELIECAAGVRRPDRGRLTLFGQDVTGTNLRWRRAAGVAVVPEDRHRQALLLEAPLWENRMLGRQSAPPNSRRGWLTRRAARRDTERLMRDYDVRVRDAGVAAASLSGGNQQKFVIGRELAGGPKVLLAAHPTRGVDIAAQQQIWRRIEDAVAAGAGVLLVSADLDELLTRSDRLLVMLRGGLVARVDPRRTSAEQLGMAMSGAREVAG
ncbi:ABC transporter ATP-binding protein [Nonomuraea guangzhouensis]|uniref:ABC transporter ATP-binding protein n=1 Tax=Nonomuraea guangzhouensis TaxID=1291555 RepID=A0ABW4G8F0_9ACTN|nr:ABC transporter ATP-binding protein [Nonomuraea guangzhouensis]